MIRFADIPPLFFALIPLLSFVGFFLLGLFAKNVFKNSAGIIATVLMTASFAISVFIAYSYFQTTFVSFYPREVVVNYEWLRFSETLSINMGILIDPVSAMMIIVVTFVSLMVHIYSLGYMKGEKRIATYYAWLQLFTFSMLGLVLSSNLFQIYIFWELVGVSSFLLIGFYYEKPAAMAAAKKAFIVTRFADLGFLAGILILSHEAGTLDFNTLIATLTDHGSTTFQSAAASSFLGISALSWGMALVFMGGAGKSAMFPLHIWLPDAMEGPTPVSALIHAATMVVAGVFLVARLFPIYALTTPTVLECITWVGAISAIFAAIIACTQTDIKRVLAYSTMSQIGFMLFALGVSKYGGEAGLGYTASLFHLFTHALFKALLFLCAGSVIHFVHSNEMGDMGSLRKYLPVAHICFLIACLAIAGVPPFSGFFSKEEILLAAWQNNKAIYWIALVTSGLTAFYMFRSYFSIFWKKDMPHHSAAHGEGGWSMTLPLIILAAGAAVAGFIPFGTFISSDGIPLHTSFHLQFSIAPVLIGLLGIFTAYSFYKTQNDNPVKLATALNGFYKAAYQKFYIDEVYVFVTKKIIFNLVGKPAAWIDKNIVDGAVNLAGETTKGISEKIKAVQSGRVQSYGAWFLAGIILLFFLFIYFLK